MPQVLSAPPTGVEPIAGSLLERLQREAALQLAMAHEPGLHPATRGAHQRLAELLGETLRYIDDRDRALRDRVRICAHLRAKRELHA